MIASESADVRTARSKGQHLVIAPKSRRQWGRDKRSRPIPILPPPISDRRIGLARLALIMTVLAWAGYFVNWIFEDLLAKSQSTAVGRTEAITYLVIVTTLSASTVGYLLSRLGFFYRARAHHRASRAVIEDFFCRDAANAHGTRPRLPGRRQGGTEHPSFGCSPGILRPEDRAPDRRPIGSS